MKTTTSFSCDIVLVILSLIADTSSFFQHITELRMLSKLSLLDKGPALTSCLIWKSTKKCDLKPYELHADINN